jgi:signal transduction histidine kinase
MIDIRLDEQLALDLLNNQPESIVYYVPIWTGSDTNKTISDFEITYCNQEACEMTGVLSSGLLGQRVRTMIAADEETRRILFNQISQVFETGQKTTNTYFNPQLEKHLQVLRSKVKNGVLTIARNITSEVQIRAEKERQADFANGILDATLNGLFALEAIRNEDGDVIDFSFIKANDQFLQLIGRKEQEVIGKSYLSILSPAKENGLFELKCQVLKTGVPVSKEIYYKGLGIDGWYNLSIARFGSNGIVETYTNITENKLHKNQLEKAAERFRTVINTSKAGMFTIIPIYNDDQQLIDFRFGIVNEAVAAYIGQTAAVLTGALASIYFPAYMENGLFHIYKDTFETGKSHQFDFHYEDGYDVFFNIHTVKVGEEVLVTFTDQTELKRMQRELESSIKDLKRSNANLEDFAYAASHDMKEPVRKVLFFSDRLKTQLGDRIRPEEKKMFERMENATKRMNALIDDLLEYSHINHGAKLKETVDLNKKVANVLEDLDLIIQEKEATITIDSLPTIKGNKRQIQQLFQNLIGNSLKYAQPNLPPQISIHIQTSKGNELLPTIRVNDAGKSFHLITVTDNGIGFDQEDADRIFNVFQRLHGNSEYKGTGVGLSIARKVVENHQGYIWAESTLNKGATFYILLPAE